MKFTLVILTLNEIDGVKALFDKIPFSAVDECLVMDGGSRDGTADFFVHKGFKVITQIKKGRGAAMIQSVEEAKGDRLVFFSPDGNENPDDIPKLLNLLNTCDMAIASRFLKGAHNEEDGLVFPLRTWANRIFTLLANVLWNKKGFISDTINGFRAVRKESFKKLAVDANDFVIEYQMSIRAMKLGLDVREMPTWEGNRMSGLTKGKSLQVGLQFLRFLLKEIFIVKKKI
ncbi:MAG: glycosyltransferase family 2 protein [Candidatus Omnitrophota bacterium]